MRSATGTAAEMVGSGLVGLALHEVWDAVKGSQQDAAPSQQTQVNIVTININPPADDS